MASPLQYKLAQINCHVLQGEIFNLLFNFLNDNQAEPGRLSETKPISKPELHCIIQNTAVFSRGHIALQKLHKNSYGA